MNRPRLLLPCAQYETPMASALLKIAEAEPTTPDTGEAGMHDRQLPEIKHPLLHAAKVVLPPALAFGGGYMAGYGAQLGLEKLLGKHMTPASPLLHTAVPLIGGAASLAYQQYKGLEQKELRRALKAYQNQSAGVVPVGELPR